MKGCCFTGYRPEKSPFPYDSDNKDYIAFENSLIEAITRALSDGFDTFYCGGAMGFDTLAAELLLLMRRTNNIKIILVKPFATQDAKFSDEWRERYNYVQSNVDEIVCLSEKYFPKCFEERNCYMVDRSERVIAFYDGKPGGTRNTVAYATRQGKEVINLPFLEKEPLQYTVFEAYK